MEKSTQSNINSDSETMISIRAVSKEYSNSVVVNNVSLEIKKNTITAIVGTSGSGKSTLLRMINRLVAMSSGQIFIDGKDITQEPINKLRRGIGYAIQGHGLFPHRTVAQNIATVPILLRWDKKRIDERVEELLTLFNLDPNEFAHKYPHQLSGGQQQRVGVARALASKPPILLMDEPFGALDPVIRAKAQEDLLLIQKTIGVTIILVTHDMDEAFHLGDKIGVMNNGKLLQYTAPADIILSPQDHFCVELTGTTDRSLKLLSLSEIAEHFKPITTPLKINDNTNTINLHRTLREALSEMAWKGVEELIVTDEQRVLGSISLKDVLQSGRGRAI